MLRPDITVDLLQARVRDALPGHFGYRVTAIAEGRAAAEMAVQPWMLAPNGYLHAASVMALADTCAGTATMAHLPTGAKSFTTIELKCNFLGSAVDGVVRCEAVADHLGRNTQVWSVTVVAPSGKTMALFRCTQMVLW